MFSDRALQVSATDEDVPEIAREIPATARTAGAATVRIHD
jgi:hypothetical protein